MKEIDKRLKPIDDNTAFKPKFDFRGCKLNDDHVIQLVTALGISPCISKLDLRDNKISSIGCSALLTLLNAQVELVKSQPLDSLLDAIFLSDIDLSERSQPPGFRDLINIMQILKTENAKITIRNKYFEYGGSNNNIATKLLAEKLYLDIVDDKANQAKLQTKLTLLFSGLNIVGYEELEEMILNELVANDSLRQLSSEQVLLSRKSHKITVVEEPRPESVVDLSVKVSIEDSKVNEPPSKRISTFTSPVVKVSSSERGALSPINDKASVAASIISKSSLKTSEGSYKSSRFDDDYTYTDDALKKTYSSKVEFHGDVDNLIDSIHDTGILDIKSSNLNTINIPQIISSQFLHKIKVLVLRDNSLRHIGDLGLPFLKCLTDLDLAHNKFSGAITDKSIPSAVLRLDLSNNNITDISALQGTCYNLKMLNISNNALKRLPPLPTKLEWLDLSDNKLSELRDLRVLSLSPKIAALGLAGNPMVDNEKSDWKIRVISYLPDIAQIDHTLRAGYKLKERVMQYNEMERTKQLALAASPKVSRSQQEKSDHARFKVHHHQSQQLEISRQKLYKEMSDMKLFPKQSMTPVKINALTERLYSPYSGKFDTSSVNTYQEAPKNKIESSFEGDENYLRRQDPVTIVNIWLLKGQQEIARATQLVSFAFRICDYQLFSKHVMINFIKAIDSLPFLQGVMLSPDVDNAMIDLPNDAHSKALGDLAADTLETMVALSYVLRNIRQIMVETGSDDDISATLRKYLDEYLSSSQCQIISTSHNRSLQTRYQFANKVVSPSQKTGNGSTESVFDRLAHTQIHHLTQREQERDFDAAQAPQEHHHRKSDEVFDRLAHTEIHHLTQREQERDFDAEPHHHHHVNHHESDEVFERLAHTPIHHLTHEFAHVAPPATERSSEDIDTGKYDSAIDRLKNRLKTINKNKESSLASPTQNN